MNDTNNRKNGKSKKATRNSQMNHNNRCNLWKPGEPLTQNDLDLLKVVQDIRKELGYTPRKKEVRNINVIYLKQRFRTWKDVIAAAGLPHYNDPEEVKRRQQILKQNGQLKNKL